MDGSSRKPTGNRSRESAGSAYDNGEAGRYSGHRTHDDAGGRRRKKSKSGSAGATVGAPTEDCNRRAVRARTGPRADGGAGKARPNRDAEAISSSLCAAADMQGKFDKIETTTRTTKSARDILVLHVLFRILVFIHTDPRIWPLAKSPLDYARIDIALPCCSLPLPRAEGPLPLARPEPLLAPAVVPARERERS